MIIMLSVYKNRKINIRNLLQEEKTKLGKEEKKIDGFHKVFLFLITFIRTAFLKYLNGSLLIDDLIHPLSL